MSSGEGDNSYRKDVLETFVWNKQERVLVASVLHNNLKTNSLLILARLVLRRRAESYSVGPPPSALTVTALKRVADA
jgi:hypothetical protein